MSDYKEMSDQIDRADRIIEETRAAVALATEALAAANRALLSLSKALGERQGLRAVPDPEMAVWMETLHDSGRK